MLLQYANDLIRNMGEFEVYMTFAFAGILLLDLFLCFATFDNLIKSKKVSYLWFALSFVSLAVWILTVYFVVIVGRFVNFHVIFLSKLSYASSGLSIIFAAFYLADEFTGFSVNIKKVIFYIYGMLGVTTTLLSFIPGAVILNYDLVADRAIYGPFRWFFALIVLVASVAMIFILWSRYPNSRGVQRWQLRYLIPNLVVVVFLLYCTNIVLPSILQTSVVSAFGPIFISIYFLILFYISFNFRLISVPGLIRILLNNFLKFVYALIIYFILHTVNVVSFSIASLFFVAITITPTLAFIDRFTMRIEGRREMYLNLEKFINHVSQELDLQKLCREIEDYTNLIFPDLQCFLKILHIESKATIYKTPNLETTGHFRAILLEWIERPNPGMVILEELEYKVESGIFPENDSFYKSLLRFMQTNNIGLIIPLNTKVSMVGVLALSKRQRLFNLAELRMIESIANNSAVAISRAMLYTEVRQFADQLEHVVRNRTLELSEANTRLEALVKDLRDLNEAKTEFISMASHQLRTPISIIRGYVSMLVDKLPGPLTTDQEDMLNRTLASVKQLINIVEEILNASRIEQGRLSIFPEEFDIIELIKAIVLDLQTKAAAKQIELHFKNENDGPVFLTADKNKMLEVIMNLIVNAINYTPKGTGVVTISVKNKKDSVTVSVADTGIGIPEKFKSKIFERFSRLENARSMRPDGTGIGLYIAKTIIEAHKGKIWFESVENKGTTFSFELPKKWVEGHHKSGG